MFPSSPSHYTDRMKVCIFLYNCYRGLLELTEMITNVLTNGAFLVFRTLRQRIEPAAVRIKALQWHNISNIPYRRKFHHI